MIAAIASLHVIAQAWNASRVIVVVVRSAIVTDAIARHHAGVLTPLDNSR
ncbi:MAG: hypothetical protein AAF412_14640 [Pseudomonadota bacterium]